MQFGEIGVARAWFQHNEKGPQEGVVVGRVYRYHTQRVLVGVPNLPTCRVPVSTSYRTLQERSVRIEDVPNLAEDFGRVFYRENTPGILWYEPFLQLGQIHHDLDHLVLKLLQLGQVHHDLDHLVPHLPLREFVQHLHSADTTQWSVILQIQPLVECAT